jgi:hypothetical protein
MNYYRLLAPKDDGTIVRTEGRSQQQYIQGRGWIESGIMLEYFWPESDIVENYEEITEQEAIKLIKQ